ncbi:alpha/beta fold hydrolase [Limnobacter sp.]|uniref:alpha/beta fold hydrolase n=1 Tax=Limnobacter sp. TaxID=2003368 RepID=UPI0035157F37
MNSNQTTHQNSAQAVISATAYSPRRPARSHLRSVRGIQIHVNEWGPMYAPLIVMVHGWMDVGASFQFVVDALQREYRVIAPDWRGFGKSQWPVQQGVPGARSYWFADYLADLDALLDHYSPDAPVNLVGHSMGGNVAMMYAGVRPGRVASVVNLEGFGMLDSGADRAPKRYATWLDAIKNPSELRLHPSLESVAQRLQKTNPRLPANKALFLAQHWSQADDDGYRILGDPAHKIPNPIGYRLAEAQACWACITAPVLHVEAAQTEAGLWLSKAGEPVDFEAFRKRFEVVPDWRCEIVDDAGHMVHHDQPEVLARLIESHFFG